MRNAYGSWVQDLTLLMYEANGIDINTKSDTDKEPAEAPKTNPLALAASCGDALARGGLHGGPRVWQDALTVALWEMRRSVRAMWPFSPSTKRQAPPDAPNDELGRKHQAAQSKQRASTRSHGDGTPHRMRSWRQLRLS